MAVYQFAYYINCSFDPLVKKREQNRVCAISRSYKKEESLCIHTVWAALLKYHPLSSRTDPLPLENSVTTATPPTCMKCPSAEMNGPGGLLKTS